MNDPKWKIKAKGMLNKKVDSFKVKFYNGEIYTFSASYFNTSKRVKEELKRMLKDKKFRILEINDIKL